MNWKTVRLQHHKEAYYQLRQHPGVVADLEARGRAIFEACGGDAAGYGMSSTLGRRNPYGRWRIGIYTRSYAAMADNADHNTLINALGAGR